MINYCDTKDLRIYSDIEPKPCARVTLPSTSKDDIKDIEKRPFLNKKHVTFYIYYKNEFYVIGVKKNYAWDGASIPVGFRWMLGGKGNPEFLIPSMVHDIMCENKDVVNRNRKLSSLIFYYLLLACKCNKLKAKIMYAAVDNFQRLFGGWNNE